MSPLRSYQQVDFSGVVLRSLTNWLQLHGNGFVPLHLPVLVHEPFS